MRVHAVSSSEAVRRTMEKLIISSGHLLAAAEDAELILTDQLHPLDKKSSTTACMTVAAPGNAHVVALSLPASRAQIIRALITPHTLRSLPLARGWTLDLTERRASHSDGGRLNFTEKECELLTALVQQHPTPLSREALLSRVWGVKHPIDTHTLETHIYRLRQKLASVTPAPCDIVTVHAAYGLVLDADA